MTIGHVTTLLAKTMRVKFILFILFITCDLITVRAQTEIKKIGEEAFWHFANNSVTIKDFLVTEDELLELLRIGNQDIDKLSARKQIIKELSKFDVEIERAYSNGSSLGIKWDSITNLTIESDSKELIKKNSISLGFNMSSVKCHFCSNGIEGQLTFREMVQIDGIWKLGTKLSLITSRNKPLSTVDLRRSSEIFAKTGFYEISENSQGIEVSRHNSEQKLFLKSDILLTSKRIKRTELVKNKQSSIVNLKISLDSRGRNFWQNYTENNKFKEIAFVFNGLVLQTPKILSTIDNGEILLSFSFCSLEALNIIVDEISNQK